MQRSVKQSRGRRKKKVYTEVKAKKTVRQHKDYFPTRNLLIPATDRKHTVER